MNILVIGGTRNMGHFLTLSLLAAGHTVTVLNRGKTRDELPEEVERLRADRTEPDQMRAALRGRSFDAVVDMVLYQKSETETIIDLLAGHVGHYVMISSGQVYLVRDGITRPFRESDYDGKLLPMPAPNTYDYEEWQYGMQKRTCEGVLHAAWRDRGFPYTVLRMPMVNSERDPFQRLYGYVLRIKDGGPILVPYTPDYPLRHVYSKDVVAAIIKVITEGRGKGSAYNIAQDETVSLDEFLDLLGRLMGKTPQIVRMERERLDADGFLPYCSPFSDVWMSELDNTRSKTELGVTYTPLAVYLEKILDAFKALPPPQPLGFRRRRTEKQLVQVR